VILVYDSAEIFFSPAANHCHCQIHFHSVHLLEEEFDAGEGTHNDNSSYTGELGSSIINLRKL
jgi:hypothetical protein